MVKENIFYKGPGKKMLELFHDICSSINVFLFVFDRKARFVFCKVPEKELLYANPQDFLGKEFYQVMPEHVNKKFRKAFKDNKEGREAGFVYQLNNKFFNASLYPIIKNDEFDGSVALIRDISDRKEIEKKLIEEKEWSTSVISAAPSIIIALGKKSVIKLFNKAAERITGYKKEEVLGKRWIELFIPKERRKELYKIWDKIVNNKLIKHSYENPIITKKGDKKIISWNNSIIKKSENDSLVLSVGRDVTQQKRLEHDLKERIKELRMVYHNSRILFQEDEVESALEKIVKELPSAYQHPSITCARIEYDGKVYENDDFWASRWSHSASFKINGNTGVIKVYYKEKKEFLDEEKEMLKEVANQVGTILGRKKTLKNLKKSEKKYRTLIENTGTAIVVIEEDTTISYANQFFEELSGYSKKEVEGKKKWTEFVTKEYLEKMKKYHYKRRKEKAPKSYEFDFINKKGETRRILLFIDVIPDTKKSVASLIDITELKELEKELRASEKKYRLIFKNSLHGLALINNKGRIIDVNDAVLEISGGMKREEIIGSTVFNLGRELKISHKQLMKAFKTIVKTGSLKKQEWKIINQKGKEKLLHINHTKINDNHLIMIQDVTEQKRAEDKLRTREQELRAIFNSTSDAIIVLDLKGKILRVNEPVINIGGYKREDLIGNSFRNLKGVIPKRQIPKLIKAYGQFLMGRDPGYLEARLKTKKGKELFLEIRLSFLIKEGKRAGVIVVMRDITERKKKEELKEKVEAQEELEQLRKNFLIMITHELKQPLTPIMGYAGLLKNKSKDAEKLDYLERIISNAYEMRDMINRILTLLKLEAGTLEFDFKEHDLSSIVENSLVNKKSMIDLKKIKVNKNLKSVYVNCDRERMKDVFINLLDNAVKFSEKGDSIELKTWADKTKAYASVKDYGVGIRKDDIKKLFKKFYQTKEGKQRGGTGIGLTMIKQVIKRHDGDISVKSKHGEWTKFIIELPKAGS